MADFALDASNLPQYADEEQMIRQAQGGDLDAFNALVMRHQDAVYHTAYRLMGDDARAQDMSQETFFTAYRKLESFKGGYFRAWLIRIVSNLCYDELRRTKRRPADSLDEMADEGRLKLADDAPTPEQSAQDNELQRAIQDCINGLNPDQRATLVLCDVQGMSYELVAETTQSALGTVKSRLARARLAVRRCLQNVQELLPPEYRLLANE